MTAPRDIKILGTGCPKCTALFERAETAVAELAVDGTVEKVTDINEILGYGVLMTPALVVDGEIKAVGKVPTVEEIKVLLG